MIKKSIEIGKFNSKLNFYKLIPYLVDRCICPAPCRSRQTLEKNVLSWSLAGTENKYKSMVGIGKIMSFFTFNKLCFGNGTVLVIVVCS